jgi:hypothetical protein
MEEVVRLHNGLKEISQIAVKEIYDKCGMPLTSHAFYHP